MSADLIRIDSEGRWFYSCDVCGGSGVLFAPEDIEPMMVDCPECEGTGEWFE